MGSVHLHEEAHTHAAVCAALCTAPPQPLSLDALQEFASSGFLALRGFLEGETLTAARAALGALLRDLPRSVPAAHAFFERKGDPASLKQLQALHVHSPALGALGAAGAPAALAAALLGARAVLQNVQYFCKAPRGTGAPTPPHQDGAYFMLRDPSRAVTLWLALDDVDEGNGAVRYLRGSHLGGLLPHEPPGVLGFSRGVAGWGAERAAACEAVRAAPGDLLAHHSLTVHCAGGNASEDRWRRALGFIYYAEGAEVDEAAKAAYEEGLRRKWREEGKL
jgi:phytanoyl-CoA hydroxylase